MSSGARQAEWWLLYAGKEGGEEEAASLLARVRQGDPSAFDEIVRRYQTRVYNLAYRMLRTREEAEDVTQEAFLKAFQSLPALRAPEALGAWIGRIASTLCLARLRSPKYQRERAAEDLMRRAEEAAKPEDELSRAVREAVAQLPPHYRLAVVAFYLEGCSYEEAARHTGVGVRTLKTRLYRARQQLRERLREVL